MHRSGIAFGAHTLTHPDLTRLPAELLEAEVVDGKRVIEDALGSRVDTFAYPFGRYDKRCRELVSRHFLCACSDKLVGSTEQRYLRRGTWRRIICRVKDCWLQSLQPGSHIQFGHERCRAKSDAPFS